MNKKKDLEKKCLEGLINFAPLRNWKIKELREEPDSILIGPRKKEVGVEVVHYHAQDGARISKYTKEALWENVRWKLHNKRAKLPQGSPLKEISGRIYFRNDIAPGKKDADRFVAELMDFIKEIQSDLPNGRWGIFVGDPKYKVLCKHMDQIKLLRTPGIIILLWDAPKISGGIFKFTESELNSIVSKKAKKLTTYKQNLPSVDHWLLIIGMGDSTWRSILYKPDAERAARKCHEILIKSKFSKIWIVDMKMKWAIDAKKVALDWVKDPFRRRFGLI